MGGGDRPAGHFRTTAPGSTTTTSTPNGAISRRKESLTASSANSYPRKDHRWPWRPCRPRTDVDHATLAVDQGRQQCLGNGDVAEEVDLEQASPLVDREGLERYVEPMPALFTSARTTRPCGSPCTRAASARMWSGLVMSMISGSIPAPGLHRRPGAPDPREDVKPPPGQFRAVAAPMPVDAPVIMAISWIQLTLS